MCSELCPLDEVTLKMWRFVCLEEHIVPNLQDIFWAAPAVNSLQHHSACRDAGVLGGSYTQELLKCRK